MRTSVEPASHTWEPVNSRGGEGAGENTLAFSS